MSSHEMSAEDLNGLITTVRVEGATYDGRVISTSCRARDEKFDKNYSAELKSRVNEKFSRDLNIYKRMRVIIDFRKDNKKLAGGSVVINKMERDFIANMVEAVANIPDKVYADFDNIAVIVCQQLFELKLL